MRKTNLLNPLRIIETLDILEKKISDRFPDSGLRAVCSQLLEIAHKTKNNIDYVSKPNILLRLFAGCVILFGFIGIIYSLTIVKIDTEDTSLHHYLALSEGIFNNLILISGALFFLVTIESKIKRKRSLQSLHELRVICHVIDMHQLNKDPYIFVNKQKTTHSPKRNYTKFELQRYLDYCSETSALVAKVAALYAQSIPDEIVISSVNEIEVLTTGLSRKVWQKIRVLQDI